MLLCWSLAMDFSSGSTLLALSKHATVSKENQLGYSAVWSVESQPAFQRNKLHLSSGSKTKPRKKPSRCSWKAELSLPFDSEGGTSCSFFIIAAVRTSNPTKQNIVSGPQFITYAVPMRFIKVLTSDSTLFFQTFPLLTSQICTHFIVT